VAGHVAELVASRLSAQGPANPNSHAPEGEGGSSQGEIYSTAVGYWEVRLGAGAQ